MTWFRVFALAWSDGNVKALNFSNSTKKLSRKEDGVGANGFAGGHQSVRDRHSWPVPWRASFSVLGRALHIGRQDCSLEASLEMSRSYEVKQRKKIITHENMTTGKYGKGVVMNTVLDCSTGMDGT